MNKIKQWFLRLLDWIAPRETVPTFTPPRLTVELRTFDWLTDYGPLTRR